MLQPPGSDMLVVAQFRNPYSWVEAMRWRAHHLPLHKGNSWVTFVTKLLIMSRYGTDLTVTSDQKADVQCQEGYTWNEVIPCHPDKYMGQREIPIYELNHYRSDGAPYFRIIDLRADKIKNFLEVKDYKRVKFYRAVRYETMVEGGTEWLIRELEDATGLKADCKPHPPAELQKRTSYKEFVDWMKENVDWETEALIGYKKEDIPVLIRNEDAA